MLQSAQESRAKGLQSWTEQQAAAKQAAMQGSDPSRAGTSQWAYFGSPPMGLHYAQLMPESSPESGDDSTAGERPQDDCANDPQPEDVSADESQPEDYLADDLQPEHDWACPDDSQPESVWARRRILQADDSEQEGDYADDSQPEDKSGDALQQEDDYANDLQPDVKGIDDIQQGNDCANKSQSESDGADGEGDPAFQNWPACENEEEPGPLDIMQESGQWEEDMQTDLCLSLSSDEEECG